MPGVVVGGGVAWTLALLDQLRPTASAEASGTMRAEALAARAVELGARVLVIGPGVEGNVARAIADARAHPGGPRIVVVGQEDDDEVFLLTALASGASAYLPFDSPVREVAEAVRRVELGQAVVPGTVAPALLDLLRNRSRGIVLTTLDGVEHRLTQREWEVLVLARQGRSTAEIATALFVSATTVRTHVAALHHKLGSLDGRRSDPDDTSRNTNAPGGGAPGGSGV